MTDISKKEKKLKALKDILELNKSGYAGIDSTGGIVDRRKHPEAVPVPENKSLNIPAPALAYLCDEMRHLICVPYSKENLHKMAEDLGIKRCWFHKDHYDIPKRRITEIQEKCEVVDARVILRILQDHGLRGGPKQKNL